MTMCFSQYWGLCVPGIGLNTWKVQQSKSPYMAIIFTYGDLEVVFACNEKAGLSPHVGFIPIYRDYSDISVETLLIEAWTFLLRVVL